MQRDADEILLQLLDSVLDQQRMICALGRNDLILIESVRAEGVSPAALSAAAQTVLSTLHSVDALADRLRGLELRVRNH
jgi:hypothetical protein